MAWCVHGGKPRWWKDSSGHLFGSCRLCGAVIIRAGKKKKKKRKPEQLPLPL